jgi:hypothetical protein
VHLRIEDFSNQHALRVADLPGLDVVLGMDFLEQHNPKLQWKQRMMEIEDPDPEIDNVYRSHANSTNPLPHIESNCVTLCTMQDLADSCSRGECDGEEIFVGLDDVVIAPQTTH